MAEEVFAEDLISCSYLPTGNLPSNLTPVDLEAIFSCNASLLSSSYTGPVTENEIGGRGTDAVMPVLPKSGSDTRSDWMGDLGLGNSSIGSCVVNGSCTYNGSAYPGEENEGTNPVFLPADNPDADDGIFPYSGGDYVCYTDTEACQASQFDGGYRSDSLVLGDMNGKAPLTGTFPNRTINVAGFDVTFDRSLFVDSSAPAPPRSPDPPPGAARRRHEGQRLDLRQDKGGTGQSDIVKYGFANSADCGTVSLTP